MNVRRALEIVVGTSYCSCRICEECKFNNTDNCPTQADADVVRATELLIKEFGINLEEIKSL